MSWVIEVVKSKLIQDIEIRSIVNQHNFNFQYSLCTKRNRVSFHQKHYECICGCWFRLIYGKWHPDEKAKTSYMFTSDALITSHNEMLVKKVCE